MLMTICSNKEYRVKKKHVIASKCITFYVKAFSDFNE